MNKLEKGQRLSSLDYVRGICIFLVVWIHCIQYFFGQVFENLLTTKTIAFHMPVFMIVAGYLFSRKLGNRQWGVIGKRFLRLIVPNCVVGGGILIVALFLGTAKPGDFLRVPFCCWFTANLFATSLLYWIGYRWVRNEVVLVLLLSGMAWMMPGGVEYLKFFMPFFGVGIVFCKYNLFDRRRVSGNSLTIMAVLSVAALWFWKPEYAIYSTKCPTVCEHSLRSVVAYGVRLITGVLVTLTLVQLLNRIRMKQKVSAILQSLSRNSLGIYVIHYLLLSQYAITTKIPLAEPSIDLLAGILAIAIIYILTNLFEFIRKSNTCKMLILGEK